MSAPDRQGQPGVVGELFPFKEFFADAPQPLFKGQSYDEVSTRHMCVSPAPLWSCYLVGVWCPAWPARLRGRKREREVVRGASRHP